MYLILRILCILLARERKLRRHRSIDGDGASLLERKIYIYSIRFDTSVECIQIRNLSWRHRKSSDWQNRSFLRVPSPQVRWCASEQTATGWVFGRRRTRLLLAKGEIEIVLRETRREKCMGRDVLGWLRAPLVRGSRYCRCPGTVHIIFLYRKIAAGTS